MAKYFTLSFDDGLEQDKEIIKILKAAGLACATFNLNSEMMGQKSAIGRIGDFGFSVKPLVNGHLPKDFLFMKYQKSFRISEDEIRQVYEGFEVAAHGARHLLLNNLSGAELEREIIGDRDRLSELTGTEICGFIYPFGMTSPAVDQMVKDAGFLYTRSVRSSKSFTVPENPLSYQPTCAHLDSRALELVDTFVQAEDQGEDMLCYLWGHGYEMDYGSKNSSYEHFKRLIDKVAGRSDIICCNNAEAFRRLR